MSQDAKIPGDMFNDAYFKSIAKKFYNICSDCEGKYGKWEMFVSTVDKIMGEKRSCNKCGKTQYRKAELIS